MKQDKEIQESKVKIWLLMKLTRVANNQNILCNQKLLFPNIEKVIKKWLKEHQVVTVNNTQNLQRILQLIKMII